MRHLKIAIGLIGAICACGIFTTPALAFGPEFEATPGAKGGDTLQTVKKVGKLKAVYPQLFTLKAEFVNKADEKIRPQNFSLHCTTIKATGAAPVTPSSTIKIKVKYEKCWYGSSITPPGKGSEDKAKILQSKEDLTEFEYNAGEGSFTQLTPIVAVLTKAKCVLTIDSASYTPLAKPAYSPLSITNELFKPEPAPSKKFAKEFPEGQHRVELEEHAHSHDGPHEKGEKPEMEGGVQWSVSPITRNARTEHEGECAILEEGEHAEYEKGKFEGGMKLEMPGGQFKVNEHY